LPFRAQVHTVFISIWVNQSEPKPSASAYPEEIRVDRGTNLEISQQNWSFTDGPVVDDFFFGRKSGNLTANRNDG